MPTQQLCLAECSVGALRGLSTNVKMMTVSETVSVFVGQANDSSPDRLKMISETVSLSLGQTVDLSHVLMMILETAATSLGQDKDFLICLVDWCAVDEHAGVKGG